MHIPVEELIEEARVIGTHLHPSNALHIIVKNYEDYLAIDEALPERCFIVQYDESSGLDISWSILNRFFEGGRF